MAPYKGRVAIFTSFYSFQAYAPYCISLAQTLGVLSPRTESTLEYDLTRLVTRVAWPERPVVGVLASIPNVLGEPANPMMMQMGQRPPQGWWQCPPARP